MLEALKQWWLCRTKQCFYYTHYLAYGPAHLTHDGYHAAAKQCDYWQKRYMGWLDAHPDSDPIAHPPEALERQCEAWERRIRA